MSTVSEKKVPYCHQEGKGKIKKGIKLHKNQQKCAKLFKKAPYFD